MKVTVLLEHLLQQGRCVSIQGAWALSNTIIISHSPTLQLPSSQHLAPGCEAPCTPGRDADASQLVLPCPVSQDFSL